MVKKTLKDAVDILENHLRSYGHELSSEAFIFIQNNIYNFRRKIRDAKKRE